MKNANILFVSTPITSHLNSTLSIVPVLVRRGHRVTCATTDPFLNKVEALGAEVIKYRFGSITARVVEEDENAYCRLATSTLVSVLSFYEKDRPDVVIYDLTNMAGPILANKWQIPAIKISPNFALVRAALDQQIRHAEFRAIVLETSARADRFLERHGVGINGYVFHRENLNIHMMPRDFEPCNEALDKTCFYPGRCAGEQVPFGDWRRRNQDNRPIVLVATSRSYVQGPDYFRTCVAAFSDLSCHVILSISDDDADLAALAPLPSNVEIVQKTSHTRILPYASLLVFMGGNVSANEAAYHGVPWVATSLGVSELEWLGDILAGLGLGVHLKGADVSPVSLRRAALEVLESATIRENVRQFQHKVRRDAGSEETANRIEEYLEEKVN